MLRFVAVLAVLASLPGCAGEGLVEGRRSNTAWPLNLFSSEGVATLSTQSRDLRYYFVCRVKVEPLPAELTSTAHWKVNFLNFTKDKSDLFDGNTKQVVGAFGIQYDEVGGWFMIIPVTEHITGDCGITRAGIVYVRRDLLVAKLGDGLVRCKYKYPNPSGAPEQDRQLASDMTLIGVPIDP